MATKVSPIVLSLRLVNKATARELFSYCYSLMVWNFSMLLINGLDLTLVGRFQFSALASYAIASALVNTIQGVQLAIFNATMPRAAVLHARRETAALGRLVVQNTQAGMLLLLILGMPLLIYAGPLLRVWVGAQYVSQGSLLLNVLVIANIIRLIATPYNVALVASGQQRLVTLSPMMEGVTNLAASIFLGIKYGVVWVAVGTLIGATVGVLGRVLYNIPRTAKEIELKPSRFLLAGVGQPMVTMAFLILCAVYSLRRGTQNPYIFFAILAATLLASGGLIRGGRRPSRQNA